MRSSFAGLLTLVALVLLPRLGWAQTPSCDALKGDKKALATAILGAQHPYDCCDGTIAACLAERKPCRLARSLANQICRMAAAGKDRTTIERALTARATTMTSPKTVAIDLGRAERLGEEKAKVTAVAYVCARCPYCAQLVPKLHEAITNGALKGKVKAYIREFPIRGHKGSTEGGMAFVAATRLGKGWPFALKVYRDFDVFDVAKLPDSAATVGMDRAKFAALLTDADVRKELVASKKEGVRNGVSSTPTVFVNGRSYSGPLDVETVVDLLAEEHDRKTGKTRD
jgi:protein-disulfide isomerase